MKKQFIYFAIFALIVASFFTVDFAVQGAGDSIKVSVNYGEGLTHYNRVVLSLEIIDKNISTSGAIVQFSLDNKNWYGYNFQTSQWIKDHRSAYQSFFPNFDIGEAKGQKKIYVRVIDRNQKQWTGMGTINYSPIGYTPTFKKPISVDSGSSGQEFAKAAITSGSGTSSDPYMISNHNTGVIIETLNTTEVAYSYRGTSWSDWNKVKDSKANMDITFDNAEGQKLIYLKGRNEFGVESDIIAIYYVLDKTPPQVDINTKFHGFIALNGTLEFDLSLYDKISNSVEFSVEIDVLGKTFTQRGKVDMFIPNKPTIVPITISGLPVGNYTLKITAQDEAGNKSTKNISVNSIK